MRRFSLVIAVLVLPIVTVLSVLACDDSPNIATPVPAAEQPDIGDRIKAQAEPVSRPDQPTPAGAAAVETQQPQAESSPTPEPPVDTALPSGSPAPPQAETAKTTASGIPDGVRWVLESVDGKPAIDDTFAALTIRGDSHGGFDGCNSFGGKSEDGTPVAASDGTFSAPDTDALRETRRHHGTGGRICGCAHARGEFPH